MSKRILVIPEPAKRVMGDLSNKERVLIALEIVSKSDEPMNHCNYSNA